MKTILVVFLTLGVLLNSHPAKAADLNTCDLLYSHRGADLMPAVECYGSLVSAADPNLKLKLYERAFIALSAVVNDSPKTKAEVEAIAKGLTLLSEMEKVYSKTADFAYWRAVFVSFDALQRDRGSVLPTHLFGVLKTIQQDLRVAIDLDPSVHVYGPHRVLGIMHTQMPGIVGGDKVLAEKMLLEAYSKAPALSGNHVAYARILQVNGKDEIAKTVLKKFLDLKSSELNPYPEAPLRGLQSEINRDRATAQDLLEQLNED